MKSLLKTTSDEADPLFAEDLDAAASGDEQAVTRLVAEFQPCLLDFAKRRGATDPEGVVNLTLSAGIGGLGSFRGTDRRAFRAYLYQILRRRIVDEFRRASARPTTVNGLDGELMLEVVDEEASTFDDRVADREMVERILEQLTSEQREILEMRVLTGMTIKETAVMTGRSEMAVKSMQRRALLSLRSLVIAAAVLILGILGLRLLTNLGEGVVVVENGPAGNGGGQTVDGPPVDGGDGNDGESVDVLEAEIPEVDSMGSGVDASQTGQDVGDSDGLTTAGRDDGSDVATEDSPGAAPSANPGAPADESTGTGSSGDPADGEEGRSAELGYAAPCSITTDGTPVKGEVAFVTYHFTGPYELFRGTSADVIGPRNESALIPGKRNPNKVWDGTTLPFVISGNMFPESGFRVQTLLADGGVKTTCDLSKDAVAEPCRVTTDGSPKVGETASVVYRPGGQYSTLVGQSTYVPDVDGEVAFGNPTPAELRSGAKRNFTIDRSMMTDDGIEVRTVFDDGTAGAACRIVD